jgi:hypothetical protein
MENTNDIVSNIQPPFETSSGGSLNKETLTSYQKKIYDNALSYATKNNDPSPKDFALNAATKTQISYGKNNPFGDLATKSQPGTIKNGIKYRDYSTVEIPMSKQYEQHIQELNNQQLAQEQEIDNLAQTQQVPEEQFVQQELSQEPQQSQELQQPQNNIQFQPQQAQSVYERNYSDQQVQSNNSTQQLDAINPIQQMAHGGYTGKSYEGGGNLNRFDVGGTHEQNKKYSGIPQGMGVNNKLNTVEQNESSFNISGKKFIFSNRIMLDGSYRDHPLNKK